MALPSNPDRRCTATAKGSGERCQKAAILGGRVCSKHGGSAPQVKRKAQMRLAELVEPSIGRMARILVNGSDRDAIRVAENVLDRTGFPRTAVIDGDDARALLVQRLQKMREEHDRQLGLTRGGETIDVEGRVENG